MGGRRCIRPAARELFQALLATEQPNFFKVGLLQQIHLMSGIRATGPNCFPANFRCRIP
jgi:hypothetical protein